MHCGTKPKSGENGRTVRRTLLPARDLPLFGPVYFFLYAHPLGVIDYDWPVVPLSSMDVALVKGK